MNKINTNRISYSAPLPIVLSGNFGERYGKPLLACAGDYRVICNVRETFRREAPENVLLHHIEKGVIDYLRGKSIPFQVPPHRMQISTEKGFNDAILQPAIIVSASASLIEFYSGEMLQLEDLNSLSFRIMKKIDKTDLGYCTSVSCFGGLIYARREFEFLKPITRLTFKIPQTISKQVFIKRGDRHKKFGDYYNKNPEKAEEFLNKLEKNTRRMTVAIASENIKLFKDAMDSNSKLYSELEIFPDIYPVFEGRKKIDLLPLLSTHTGLTKIRVSKV